MYQVISAIYEDGMLKPTHHLSLEEGQQVLLLILPWTKPTFRQPNLKRVAALRQQATTWLREQPKDAVRRPLRLPEAQERKQNEEFDAALGAIRKRAKQISVEEIEADISKGLAEVVLPSERVWLEAELERCLGELAQ